MRGKKGKREEMARRQKIKSDLRAWVRISNGRIDVGARKEKKD